MYDCDKCTNMVRCLPVELIKYHDGSIVFRKLLLRSYNIIRNDHDNN